MEKLHRTRIVVAKSERISVWHASQNEHDARCTDEVSVECPHCGKEAIRFELEVLNEPQIEVVTDDL